MLETASVNWSGFSEVWSFMAQIGVLLIALLFGNFLRLRVGFLRKMLFPAALVAGILILILKTILQLLMVDTNVVFDNAVMQIITYHTLGLGFTALTLKRNKKSSGKANVKKIFGYSLINGGTYMLQASVGLLITLLFFSKYYYAGIILPLGFAQGPGNAMIWGSNYEKYGLIGGASFGLTIATVGFIVSSVVGVIYMNVMRRRGKLIVRESKAKQTDDASLNGNAPDSGSVDKLSINMGLVALAYTLCYGFMWLLSSFGIQFLTNLVWGLNFMWAMLFGMVVKVVLTKMEKNRPDDQTYRSNYLLDRISGFCFDLMIVAGVAAIEWESIAAYWVPILMLCVLGTVLTFLYIYYAAKHNFPGYEHETFLSNYGTLTGTASNGMILLREIDPDFVTPAATYLVMANVFNLLLNAPLFLLLASVPTGMFGTEGKTSTWICFGLFTCLFLIYSFFLFRRPLMRHRYPKSQEEIWTEADGYVTRESVDGGEE